MSDWLETTLGEISEDVSYGYTESASTEKIGPKFLRITDIQGGVVDWSGVPYCPITKKDHNKYRLQKGDIVVARTGNSTGENYLFNSDVDAVYASYLIKFSISSSIDSKFVWYSMRSPKWWGFIKGNKTGSAQAGANAKTLSNFPINLPPLPEQKAIAHILGKLDDKIELNRQMNETLEAISQNLFKSWFVDFDPVLDNALAAGNEIPEALQAKAEKRKLVPNHKKLLHTNPALAAQFPSAFVYNETLGKWIPEGWEVKGLKEIVTVKYGKDHKKLKEGSIPCYGSGGVMRMVERALYENESVLIPRKGTLNNITYVNHPFWSVDTMFYTMMEEEHFAKYFFYLMDRLDFNDLNEGSAVPSMTTAQLNAMNLLLPKEILLEKFDSLIARFYSKRTANNKETETLTQLRDTLLPQLISGKVRVPVDVLDKLNKTTLNIA